MVLPPPALIVHGYIVFWLTLVLSIISYRVSPFHPLAKHRGPLLCKVSKLYGTYFAIKGTYHQCVKELHEQYGPVVRVGPNELSIIEKNAIPHVLGVNGMPRGPLWDGRRFHQGGTQKGYDSIIDVRDAKVHHDLRKDWNNAFSASAVRDYQDPLEARVKQLRGHLQSVAGTREKVSLSTWFSHFAFDVVGDLAFGGCFELMREGDTNGFRRSMDEGMQLPAIMQHIPWINPLITSIPFISSKMRAFSDFGVDQGKKRIALDATRKDLFYYLARRTDRTLEEPLDRVVSNCLLTIVAGSDTTATTLTAILCFLLSERRAYNALKVELDEAFPNYNVVDGWPEIEINSLGQLPYLNAVIDEGLRLVPAVPTQLQRAPEPGSGGKMLGDTQIFIPEGVAVNIPPFALHRDPRYFSPHPDSFIPERWLPIEAKGSAQQYTTDKEAFIPFSYGPANCAGKTLARIEMRYVLADSG
ncbi:cytochrome P450 [Coprinellus micaceus]|uniref:Cytochrome P450 n=1 Tax=Coprinellus micaceus TaxID=71717 RepID=A0A4Y7TJK2_COPMI|nr:cytochrome P450 [Coprinellus micaceus]